MDDAQSIWHARFLEICHAASPSHAATARRRFDNVLVDIRTNDGRDPSAPFFYSPFSIVETMRWNDANVTLRPQSSHASDGK